MCYLSVMYYIIGYRALNTNPLAMLQCMRHVINRLMPWTQSTVQHPCLCYIGHQPLSLRLLPTTPPRPAAARPSGDHPGLMTERSDRLRVGVPISAPRAELQGARECAERCRAARVRRRARGERLAMYEDELEVLAACGLHLLRVRVVPVRERLQERAGRRRGRRVGGIGGGRSGGLWIQRIVMSE